MLEATFLGAPDSLGDGYAPSSLATDGARIVLGQAGDDTRGEDAGAAWVIEHVDGFWQRTETLYASDAARLDEFGSCVGIHDSTILVGAPGDDGGRGALYSFEGPPEQRQQTRLLAFDRQPGASFGCALALCERFAFVGSDRWVDPVSRQSTGAVYIFSRDPWRDCGRLTPDNTNELHGYGAAIAVRGNTVVVGAPLSSQPGRSGSVHLFEFTDEWRDTGTLFASSTQDQGRYGTALHLSEERLLVGAPYADSFGIPNRAGRGRVYSYLNDGTWTLEWEAWARYAQDRAEFGRSLTESAGVIAFGSPGFGYTLDPDDRGAVYLYDLNASDCDSNGIPDNCDLDTDLDGTIDACDQCPNDANKTEPGSCGCGNPDIDSDGDGSLDCDDLCPGLDDNLDPGLTVLDDCDNDGVPNFCQILLGRGTDLNLDRIPDHCQCLCDPTEDGSVDMADLLLYLDQWLPKNQAAERDGRRGIDVRDLLQFMSCWFANNGRTCR